MEFISKTYLMRKYEEDRKSGSISFRKIIEEAPTVEIPESVFLDMMARTMEELDEPHDHSGLLEEE